VLHEDGNVGPQIPPMKSSLNLASWGSSPGGTGRPSVVRNGLPKSLTLECSKYSSRQRAEHTCSESHEPGRLQVEILNRPMSGGESWDVE
jgi:hypothetical protein